MSSCICIKPIAIEVNTSSNVEIVIPKQFLSDGKRFILDFVLSEVDRKNYRDLIEGNEIVLIVNGVGGQGYILEDYKANIFYSDLLQLGYKYKLIFGNNGPESPDTGELPHFINVNTPCCAKAYNPANNQIID